MTAPVPTLGERYEFARQDGVWVLTCWTCEVTVGAWRTHQTSAMIADCALVHEEENHE